MEIKVEKLTDLELMRWACEMTIDHKSLVSLDAIYKCEHSPMRTQLFKISMYGIPTFVSTHFVRHNQGVVHYIKTQRDDRGGSDEANRWTPTNHGMLCNAQALINMSRKRLCTNSHSVTVATMKELKAKVKEVDPDLAEYMVRECEYRGCCPELNSCGWWDRIGIRR
jgi:hypothetical protein